MSRVRNPNVDKILAFISSGRLEYEELEEIVTAAERKMGRNETLSVGDTVVVKRIRPRYLVGLRVVVKKVNQKTVAADIPNDPKYGRFAGKDVRIPRSSVQKVVP